MLAVLTYEIMKQASDGVALYSMSHEDAVQHCSKQVHNLGEHCEIRGLIAAVQRGIALRESMKRWSLLGACVYPRLEARQTRVC